MLSATVMAHHITPPTICLSSTAAAWLQRARQRSYHLLLACAPMRPPEHLRHSQTPKERFAQLPWLTDTHQNPDPRQSIPSPPTYGFCGRLSHSTIPASASHYG